MQPNPQWEGAPPVQKFTIKDQVGQSIIYVHSGNHEDLPMKFGSKLGCRGIFIILTGRYAGEVFPSQYTVSAHLVSQLKDLKPGQAIVGRLAASGTSIALDAMTAYDANLATAWDTAHPGAIAKLAQAGIASFMDDDRNLRQQLIQQNQGQVQSSPQAQPWISGGQAQVPQQPIQSEEPPF